ncbi:MAG: hypothetical protein Q4C60_11200, partial [Eubacteriales bacterium]|nr:hypothetical protein [Eubacteriales bacterium]
LSAASRLPLLMIGRSLSRKQKVQNRASTICPSCSRLAELLQQENDRTGRLLRDSNGMIVLLRESAPEWRLLWNTQL